MHRSAYSLAFVMLAALLTSCTLNINTPGAAKSDPLFEARMARLEKLLLEKTEAEKAPPEERLARVEAQVEREKASLAEAVAAPIPAPDTVSLPEPDAAIVARDSSVEFKPWSGSMLKMGEKLEEKFTSGSKKGLVGNRPDLVGLPLRQRRFIGPSGEIVDLGDYEGSKDVVLVFMRGFSGQVCIGCTAQTLALARSQAEFAKRNAQVVVIYPGSAASVPVFLDAVKNLSADGETLPFPVLLDVNLNAVTLFDIRGSLARPTSMVVDKKGVVRYAYAGKGFDDRPSVGTLLGELDALAESAE
ncbi:redoxin domain-containing protein [bacterium]|nr:redoxin domain-containing protein [bacterium]